MANRPTITVPHRVERGTTIRLYHRIDPNFLSLIAALYPKLAPYTGADNGYSAFRENGTFIGSFGGRTFASIRKNPLFDEPGDWFLRAYLGALNAEGVDIVRNVCEQDNYGTLRLWQRMGLGVEIDKRGKAASAALTPDTQATLERLIASARVSYPDHRAYATRTLATIATADFARMIPSERQLRSSYHSSVDVTLL